MTSAGNAADRRDFDINASGTAQEHFESVAGRLETLMDQRDKDVKAAMADYVADGASEEYHAKEQQWNTVAGEVRGIIRTLRQSLGQNDETASSALTKARNAVNSIG